MFSHHSSLLIQPAWDSLNGKSLRTLQLCNHLKAQRIACADFMRPTGAQKPELSASSPGAAVRYPRTYRVFWCCPCSSMRIMAYGVTQPLCWKTDYSSPVALSDSRPSRAPIHTGDCWTGPENASASQREWCLAPTTGALKVPTKQKDTRCTRGR